MIIIPRERDGVAILDVLSSLDFIGYMKFRTEIQQALDEHCGKILANFADCPNFDPAGLTALKWAHDKVRAEGGEFRICNLGEEVRKFLKANNYDNYFLVSATEDDAMKSFGTVQPQKEARA